MLRGDQHLPVVVRPSLVQVRTRVADEVAEDVLLQVGLAVGWTHPAEGIQAGEQGPRGIARAPSDSRVPVPACRGVAAGRGDLGDHVGETVDLDGGN